MISTYINMELPITDNTTSKQLPPVAAGLVLYGARDMSKKDFYIENAQRYLRYFRKSWFIEWMLSRVTTAVRYKKPTLLVATSRRTLSQLELYKHFDLCFVSVTLLNLPFLFRKKVPFTALSFVKADLDKAFLTQMDAICPAVADRYGIERYIAANQFSAFVYDTPSTLNNFIAYFFKKMGRPVIYMQHGIYQLSNYKLDSATQHFASNMIVWGKAFKELISADMQKEKIEVACINRPVFALPPSALERSVCFMGVPLIKFSAGICEEMISVLKEMQQACEQQKMKLVYKPHPMEPVAFTKALFEKNDLQIPILSVKEPVNDVLMKYEVFTGLYSTTLIEASIQGKKVIQARIRSKQYDDYGAMGICRSYMKGEEAFTDVLTEVMRSPADTFSPDNDYIHYSTDPGAIYKKAIENILQQQVKTA